MAYVRKLNASQTIGLDVHYKGGKTNPSSQAVTE
jgi:hypothetical protein